MNTTEEENPLQHAIDLVESIQHDEDNIKKNLEIELARKKYNNTWNSCCLTIDRRAAQFFIQISIIFSVIIFATAQLVRLEDCNSQQAYLGLLTMLIGILIPSPKFSRLN